MLIFPAIDLYEGKAVRLYKGDYQNMTVYSEDPVSVAMDFRAAGACCVHLVDLEGARDGTTPNLEIVHKIATVSGLFTEIGGGIRNMETVRRYFEAGVDRVILGTAAVTDEAFLREAVQTFGERIAVGVDIKDGKVAIKGWLETAELDALTFCEKLQSLGVKTVISTDISRDGAMQGANHELYRTLQERFRLQIVASGGVSSMEDVKRLAARGLYGAIIGKAYYTGAINLKEAIEVAT
ncbi:MAG: 1-(5-phosphoribosyl)-5-[(5-phosphoribosylamino)methylideneamino]imidazole-4-carboxamide isomerase [Ruminococcaceae bacterium]|nr:1-(5-phosphoribosyl)-5-[(5-phosphoribosylamino)methylideneamino]imidazole-4-carboxamide isomerase [Oscillospiraceae bacterium]